MANKINRLWSCGIKGCSVKHGSEKAAAAHALLLSPSRLKEAERKRESAKFHQQMRLLEAVHHMLCGKTSPEIGKLLGVSRSRADYLWVMGSNLLHPAGSEERNSIPESVMQNLRDETLCWPDRYRKDRAFWEERLTKCKAALQARYAALGLSED